MLVPRPISSRITRLRERGIVQNSRRLRHLDHERTLTASQFVAGPDSSEDAVGDADTGTLSGDKAAHLRHERDQGNLSDVRALAGHVRAGDDQDLPSPSPATVSLGTKVPCGSRMSRTG